MPEKKKVSMQNIIPGAVWGKDKYKTARGGGTPTGEENAFGKGVKNEPAGKGRGGWQKVGSPGKRDEDQPRDAEGHFTYNSMIGKELKDVSKSHGKSRGTTVPPMFNGGVNGPHREGKSFDPDEYQDWADRWYHKLTGKGGEVAVAGAGYRGGTVLKIAPEEMTEIAKEFIIDKTDLNVKYDKEKKEWVDKDGQPFDMRPYYGKGDFGTRTYDKYGKKGEKHIENVTGDVSKWESKKGRPTEEESAAKRTASVTGSAVVKEPDMEKAGEFGEKKISEYKSPEAKAFAEKQEAEAKAREDLLKESDVIEDGENLDKRGEYSLQDINYLAKKNPQTLQEYEKIREKTADPNMLDKIVLNNIALAFGLRDAAEAEDNFSDLISSKGGMFKDKDFMKVVFKEYNERRR